MSTSFSSRQRTAAPTGVAGAIAKATGRCRTGRLVRRFASHRPIARTELQWCSGRLPWRDVRLCGIAHAPLSPMLCLRGRVSRSPASCSAFAPPFRWRSMLESSVMRHISNSFLDDLSRRKSVIIEDATGKRPVHTGNGEGEQGRDSSHDAPSAMLSSRFPLSAPVRSRPSFFLRACSMLTFRSSILLTGAADTPQYNTLIVVVSFLQHDCGFSVSASGRAGAGKSGETRRGPSADASLMASRLSAAPAYGLPAQRFPHQACDRPDAMRRRLRYHGGAGDVPRTRILAHGPVCPGVVPCSPPSFFSPSTPRGPHSLPPLRSWPLLTASAPSPSAVAAESSQAAHLSAPHRNRVSALPGGSPILVPAHHRRLVFPPVRLWRGRPLLSVNSASTAHELPLVLNFVVAVPLAFTAALQRRVNLPLVYQLFSSPSPSCCSALLFFWNVHLVWCLENVNLASAAHGSLTWSSGTCSHSCLRLRRIGLHRGPGEGASILARPVGIGIGI